MHRSAREEKQFFTHLTWAPGVPRQRLPSQQRRHLAPHLPDFQKWRKFSPRVGARCLMGLRNFRTCAIPKLRRRSRHFGMGKQSFRRRNVSERVFTGRVMKQCGNCDSRNSSAHLVSLMICWCLSFIEAQVILLTIS